MSALLGRATAGQVFCNCRVRYLPDADGVFRPYDLIAFDRPLCRRPGFEDVRYTSDAGNDTASAKLDALDFFADSAEVSEAEAAAAAFENRRKAYGRAKNKLFNLLMSTTSIDTFVTLTFDGAKVDRNSYADVVHRLGVWLDNRVRRNGLTYMLVPEFHKKGGIHLHGLVNGDALKLSRAHSARSGRALRDSEGRPVFNISDFDFGFTTAIPLSGENAREATAKYCYKYIIKSGGVKIGGRYYLSGGRLGRPVYRYCNVDYVSLCADEMNVGGGVVACKRMSLIGQDMPVNDRDL